jgi:hypothetical protein
LGTDGLALPVDGLDGGLLAGSHHQTFELGGFSHQQGDESFGEAGAHGWLSSAAGLGDTRVPG